MYTVKDGSTKSLNKAYVIKDATVRAITNIYAVVQGAAVLIWTAASDIISSVFSKGYWVNDAGWKNTDSWKN